MAVPGHGEDGEYGEHSQQAAPVGDSEGQVLCHFWPAHCPVHLLPEEPFCNNFLDICKNFSEVCVTLILRRDINM